MNSRLHTFYYNWYSNFEHDGRERHWNHNILPHEYDRTWDRVLPYPGGDDIGANYYPLLGCYSSSDEKTIHQHFKWMRDAGIGACVITWLGGNSFEDSNFHKYLNISAGYDIKIIIHIEPSYSTIIEFRERIEKIISKFGSHPSMYRYNDKLMFYIYDSYRIATRDWASLFDPQSPKTIRGTELDGLFIGLWVKNNGEEEFFKNGYFDGFYTYFASEGFVYGSTISNWQYMSKWAKKNNKLFIPCVGPGYIDTRIRPWNIINEKFREDGEYYDRMFRSAIDSVPDFIGLTSFNEWHEGTQIEPAVPKEIPTYTYEDYQPNDPFYYINRTRFWSKKF